MPIFGNGRKPAKTTEEVATALRERLEQQIGPERAEAIWRDPTNAQEVLEDDKEAASVAGIILQAWRDLPQEEPSGRRHRKRRSGFRRGLRLALIAAVAAWSVSLVKKSRQERHGE